MTPGTRVRRRKPVDLDARTGLLREAIERGGDRLDPVAVQGARAVLSRTDERLALGVEYTVVALAGATGSGKSSLFNALAGIEVATVGARRPTTSKPTAVVWGEGGDALLEWLDVPRRHRTTRESELDGRDQSDLRGLVLLDLPDHDSTQVSHRLEVDRLVDLVDLLVWVVDPQKYADDLLHTRYLQRLSEHQDVMVMVLNQVDRLPDDQVHECVTDLQRLLRADGLPKVPVLAMSARTGEGVGDLRDAMGEAVRHHEVVAQRVVADVETAADALRAGVGESERDPEKLPGRDLLVDALVRAAGVPAVLEAVDADYRRRARARTGWPFSRWVARFKPDPMRRLRIGPPTSKQTPPDPELSALGRSSLPAPTQAQRAQVELATRQVATRCSEDLPQRWADAVSDAAAPPGPDLADALDQAVTSVDLSHRTPVWWRLAGFVQVLLAVAAVVGLLWLVALGVVGWLRLPEIETPMVGPGPAADAAAARRAASWVCCSPPCSCPSPAPARAGARAGSARSCATPSAASRPPRCSSPWVACSPTTAPSGSRWAPARADTSRRPQGPPRWLDPQDGAPARTAVGGRGHRRVCPHGAGPAPTEVLVNETHVTVVGNLVADPVLRVTPGEREVAGFRLASTVRRYDAELGRSVDVRTSFYSVSCWGYLARNVAESLRKGERVVVTGRLDVREYAGDDKVLRTSVDVVADAVGHDLTYGTSRFTKVRRGVAAATTEEAEEAAPDGPDSVLDEEEPPFGPAESDPFVEADGMRIGRDGVPEAVPAPV